MDRLISIDQHITSVLNGWNAAFIDPIMVFASKVYVWVPLYIAIIIWYFTRQDWRRALITVATLILAFAFTDRFSYFLKESICRLRPCEDPAMAGLIRLLEKHGSLHGFPSGHATNTFCFALLTSLTARRKWWTPTIFGWAAIVSYSRIYVGKHYFGDVLCGAILGLLCGYIFYLIIERLDKFVISGPRSKCVSGNHSRPRHARGRGPFAGRESEDACVGAKLPEPLCEADTE